MKFRLAMAGFGKVSTGLVQECFSRTQLIKSNDEFLENEWLELYNRQDDIRETALRHSCQRPFLPTKQGFDSYFGIPYSIDLLPTFAKLIGVEPPQDRELDGRDINSLMLDPKAGPVRDTHLYFTATQSLAAIRQGDWKLFLSAPPANGQGKKAKADQKADPDLSGPQLYNLATDPAETKNVAEAQSQIVAKLQAEAERREAEIKQHRRPAGQLNAAK